MARRRPVEVVVENRYPAAFDLWAAHGPQAMAVLHVLLARAQQMDGSLMTRASVRDIAAQLGLSKDAVHRALRALVRAGVIEPMDDTPSNYRIHLDDRGVAVRLPDLPF